MLRLGATLRLIVSLAHFADIALQATSARPLDMCRSGPEKDLFARLSRRKAT